jgi:hypothetical protein
MTFTSSEESGGKNSESKAGNGLASGLSVVLARQNAAP